MMARHHIYITTIITLILSGYTLEPRAQEFVTSLNDRYPDKKIYLTFSALTSIRWCLNDPYQSAKLSERYSLAGLLKPLIDKFVTDKMNTSVAFLIIDFGNNSVYFKMTNEMSGQIAQESSPWHSAGNDVAQFFDEMLLHSAQALAVLEKIDKSSLSLNAAWHAFQNIKDDIHVSIQTKARVAQGIKSYYQREPTAQNQLQSLDLVTKDALSKLLFQVTDEDIRLASLSDSGEQVLGNIRRQLSIGGVVESRIPSSTQGLWSLTKIVSRYDTRNPMASRSFTYSLVNNSPTPMIFDIASNGTTTLHENVEPGTGKTLQLSSQQGHVTIVAAKVPGLGAMWVCGKMEFDIPAIGDVSVEANMGGF